MEPRANMDRPSEHHSLGLRSICGPVARGNRMNQPGAISHTFSATESFPIRVLLNVVLIS
jgi:hypothetical protein